MRYYVQYSIPRSIFMQAMLRTQIGTFVGDRGTLFFKYLVKDVCHKTRHIEGRWIGKPLAYGLNGWSTQFSVQPYTLVHTPVDIRSLYLYTAEKRGIYVPDSIERGDMLLVEEASATPQEIPLLI